MSRLSWNYTQTPLFPPNAGAVSSSGERPGLYETRLYNLSGLAGDSVGGYGNTFCDFPGGARSNVTTSGCNKPCTEAHEAVHRNDIRECCSAANTEYLFAGNDERKKAEVKLRWRNWTNLIRPNTECRAYDVSVPCYERLFKEKRCDRREMSPDEKECCGEIQLAWDDDRGYQREYKCDSTPRQIPKCPFVDATPGPRVSDAEVAAPDDAVEQQPDEAVAQARMRRP